MSETDRERISAGLFAEMIPWLEEAYPAEGCGLVVEDEQGDWSFEACDNVIDRYHELDPEEYPHTSEEFYMIDPKRFMEVDRRGDRVAVIVHSHPDTGDYFSDRDVEAALMPRDSQDDPVEPVYPGTDYLVVSVIDGDAESASLYRFDEETEDFEQVRQFGAEQFG